MLPALLLALVAGTAAVPTKSSRVTHEKRFAFTADRLQKVERAAKDAVLPVRIGLTQPNLDLGYEYLDDVSNFGKHWTAQEVMKTFAPSSESIDLVNEWLASSGIDHARQTESGGFLTFDATIEQIERLFETELYEYEDSKSGSIRIGCDEYSLPRHIAPHVDFVTPAVKLSPPVKKSVTKRDSRKIQHLHSNPKVLPIFGPFPLPPGIGNLPEELQGCGYNITPPCIRALYDIPFPIGSINNNILGIYEASPLSAYNQEDLDLYWQSYAPYIPQGTHPNVDEIDNGTAPAANNGIQNTGEGNIDFQMAYALLGDVPITNYQIGGPEYYDNTFMDSFFFAVDSTYCNATTDAEGYQCGGTPLTTIVSMSYFEAEFFDGKLGVIRSCNEAMKLALQGYTFVVCSGDAGVATEPSVCGQNGCISRDLQTQNGPIFNPSLACPYTLSVGGTQLYGDQTFESPESVMYEPQTSGAMIYEGPENCSADPFFSSGGGFSNFIPAPQYQQAAIASWQANHDPGYPHYSYDGTNASIGANGGIYNRVGRGFPDVSANGANFSSYLNTEPVHFFGTSLATPLWASILAMINQERADIGKAPVGFINAVLYEHPEVFHDITLGHSAGCGTDGFAAVSGWDPATGLGTPNYPALLSLFLLLP